MKIFSFLILLSLICSFPAISFAQEEDAWDTYIAQYDNGPGSVVLNMSLRKRAPVSKFKYVLVTGVTYKNCDSSGFPAQHEFERLHLISDSVQEVIKAITPNISAGTFTHQCERLDYYYVTDTLLLRKKLEALYSRRFSNYKPYINIKEDKNWEYYLAFLYPNEQTLNYMGDSKVVLSLMQGGDKLEKPRKVEHFIYFDEEKSRDGFIEFVKKENYKVEAKTYNNESKLYSAHISRVDKVDLSSINQITEHLRKIAATFKGDYDGWETVLVKD